MAREAPRRVFRLVVSVPFVRCLARQERPFGAERAGGPADLNVDLDVDVEREPA
jgi:hypothetical protein